jgi:NADPH-dependent curcumin reductase CurA
MVANKTLIFKKFPTGLPVPGEHLIIEDHPIDLGAALVDGSLLVEIIYSSFDPYMRGRMHESDPKSYAPGFDIGGPMASHAVAKVLKSARADFAPGDTIVSFLPIAQYAVIEPSTEVNAATEVTKIDNPHGLDLGVFIGALGMPGLTAYSGLYKIGKPKAGETIFVSSAAGAVGQVVGQIAKHEGLRVIGSVGSDEKLEFIIKELGFDGGFNYKKESAFTALPRLAPDGIDIYFENVGGEQLDAALANMNLRGRIAACGMVR